MIESIKRDAVSRPELGLSDEFVKSRREFAKFLSVLPVGIALSLSGLAGSDAADVASQPSDDDNRGFWDQVRQQFILSPKMTYFNSGSEGSKSNEVLSALSKYSKQWASSPTASFFTKPPFGQDQKDNRRKSGDFVGADADDLCLTNNTTMGLSMILMGLDFARGSEVLTTQHEHLAMLSPLNVLNKRNGVRIRELPLPSPPSSDQQIVDLFADAITADTKVLCCSHVNFTTGLRMPVKQLCKLAAQHNMISVIDGAQSMGMLDLNFKDLGCDFYACPGHKWLNGPPGTGVLYVRDSKNNPYGLWPTLSQNSYFIGQNPITDILQIRGCENTPAFTAMTDAMAFDLRIGKNRIENRLVKLSNYLKRLVIDKWGQKCLYTPVMGATTTPMCSGIMAFTPSADDAMCCDQKLIKQIVKRLREEYNIWVRNTKFPDNSGGRQRTIYPIRVSTNIFNNYRDCDRLMAALEQIMNTI